MTHCSWVAIILTLFTYVVLCISLILFNRSQCCPQTQKEYRPDELWEIMHHSFDTVQSYLPYIFHKIIVSPISCFVAFLFLFRLFNFCLSNCELSLFYFCLSNCELSLFYFCLSNCELSSLHAGKYCQHAAHLFIATDLPQ